MVSNVERIKGDLPQDADEIISLERRGWRRSGFQIGLVIAVVLLCAGITDMLDVERMTEGIPAIGTLMAEMFPPNFSDWESWVQPMIDTVAMSIADGAFSAFMFASSIAGMDSTTASSAADALAATGCGRPTSRRLCEYQASLMSRGQVTL